MNPPKFDPALIPPDPDFSFEAALWANGVPAVAGVDEAGRGALAGPVVAAVVIFPPDPGLFPALNGVRDSKQMTPEQRADWAGRLPDLVQAYGVGWASNQEIDAVGIVPATRLAMGRAVGQLPISPGHLLVDFLDLPDLLVPQTPLIKGDARALSIAAASILAKTARDAMLCELDEQYPDYGFAHHKGYATVAHRDALVRLGPCTIHRRSFRLNYREELDFEVEQ